jgi:hypothetical protein
MTNGARQMTAHVEAAYKGCGREYKLSEKTAVGGDQLRRTRVCGYFRNLRHILQSN